MLFGVRGWSNKCPFNFKACRLIQLVGLVSRDMPQSTATGR